MTDLDYSAQMITADGVRPYVSGPTYRNVLFSPN